MNKNTLLGFLIILLSFLFFNSKWYYEKILRKPHPSYSREQQNKPKPEQQKSAEKSDSKSDEIQEKKQTAFPDSLSNQEKEMIEPVAFTEPVSFDTIWIETEKIICGISELGGRIISIKTKEYTYNNSKKKVKKKGKDYIELVADGNSGGANLSINERDFDSAYFKYNGNKINKKINLENDQITLEFSHETPEYTSISKSFTFYRHNYSIELKIASEMLDGKALVMGWQGGITESETEQGKVAFQYDQKKIHIYDGKNVEHISVKKSGPPLKRPGYYNWIGLTSKYFLIACLPEKIKDAEIEIVPFPDSQAKEDKKKNKNFNYKYSIKRFVEGSEETFVFYTGPTQLTEIKKYKKDLHKVLFQGYRWFLMADKWFPPICEFVLWLLIQLQKGVKDYGIVIIILTIILKVVTYPLTHSSMKSMNKMKEIQPRINKIREKYKGNSQKMNQKIMEFYKNEGINPLGGAGGCLPMFLQMPIMISLFIVLRKAIELRGQQTFLIPWISDLSKAEVLFPLPFDLHIPLYGSNVALLPILMAILMYFQNKMSIKDPNQKAMIYMMPVMMLVMFNSLPSGLSLYFTFSTGLQVIQQIIMDKTKKKEISNNKK